MQLWVKKSVKQELSRAFTPMRCGILPLCPIDIAAVLEQGVKSRLSMLDGIKEYGIMQIIPWLVYLSRCVCD